MTFRPTPTSLNPKRRLVAIFGLDTIRDKNLYQTRWLATHGYQVHVFANHRDKGSITSDWSATIEQHETSAPPRIAQIWRFLRRNRAHLHHVELYPGGRFAWVYAVLCRLVSVKLITVERGDIKYLLRRVYPLSTRLSMHACYWLADRIWYKEPYMRKPLARWNARSFFLPNGVPIPPRVNDLVRSIDFLWVNRVIPERHPDWFADAIRALSITEEVTCVMLGFRARHATQEVEQLEERVQETLRGIRGCQCLDFTEPRTHYPRARFFVLPGDVVFGNFALLEAMSFGVVPIVSNVEGSDVLVRDGQNGILVDHTPMALAGALRRALSMTDSEWSAFSREARKTVQDGYSLDHWGRQLLRKYDELLQTNALSQ